VEHINRNAELNPTPEERQPKESPRAWKLTSRKELLTYLAVWIHIGLHGESAIEDYWHKDLSSGTIYIV